jgi:hypothetical protein
MISEMVTAPLKRKRNPMKKKSVVALLVVCALGLVAVYFGVNRYIERIDALENNRLQEQRDAYAQARVKRLQESKLLLALDELRIKLGLSDQPDAEIQIAEETTDGLLLTGAVQATLPATDPAEPEVRKRRFRIEYAESGEIRSCELLD